MFGVRSRVAVALGLALGLATFVFAATYPPLPAVTMPDAGRYGSSVGDVNGDGYDDVIFGNPYYGGSGISQAGRALLFYGSATGLPATPGWIVEGSQTDEFLSDGAPAGDVNSDGYPDVIITASGFDNGSLVNAGQASLYLGGPGGLSSSPVWSAAGDQAYAILGSAAAIGDVNGDGFGDVAIGASGYDNGEDHEGRLYVFHGSASGLNPSPAWMQEGNSPSAAFGGSVGGADFNGDGYSDLAAGAAGYGPGYEGRVVVYHGGPGGLSTTPALTLDGTQWSGYLGSTVRAIGDVNGDGYQDALIGAGGWDAGPGYFSQNIGRIDLHLGSATGLQAIPWWTTTGSQPNGGFTAVAAGDVNDDGRPDLLVTEPYRYNTGYVELRLGGAGGFSEPVWSASGTENYGTFGEDLVTADADGDGNREIYVTGSGHVYVWRQCGVIAPPSGAALSSNGTVSWQAPPEPAPDHYRVYSLGYYSCEADGYVVAQVPGDTTSFTDPYPGSAYYVTAVSADGCESARSNCTQGCTSSETPTVTSSPDAICGGGQGDARVVNLSGFDSFVWSITHGVITSQPHDRIVRFEADGSGPVELLLTATDSLNCTATVAITIPLIETPLPSIAAPQSVCANGNSESAALENASNYTSISWSIANGVLTTPPEGPEVGFFGNAEPVVLTVTATAANGCVVTAQKSVGIRTLPPPVILFTPASVCPYGTSGMATVENAQNYGWFDWSIVNGEFTTSPTGNAEVSFHATGSQAVELSVTVWDLSGCSSSSQTLVPIATLAPPAILFTPAAVCPMGSSGNATVENTQNYGWFDWSIVNGVFTTPPNGVGEVSFQATGSLPVELSVTVWDIRGCSASSQTVVPIRTVAAPAILFSPAAVCPMGSSGSATVENAQNYGWFDWSIVNGIFTTPPNGAGEVSFQATGSQPVELSVTVWDIQGCSASSQTVVPIRTLASPNILYSPATLCPNGAPGNATVEYSSNYGAFSWSIENGVLLSPPTESSVTFQATSAQPVVLSVTVTDIGGCTSTRNMTINVEAPGPVAIEASGPTTFCDGGSVTLTAPFAPSYLWSNGATTQSIAVSQSGDYTVTIGTPAGCSATSAPVTVIADAPLERPTITANGPTTFCSGGSVELTAHGAGGNGVYSYQWMHYGQPIPGATSQTFIAAPAGNDYYYVVITDSLGCESLSSAATIITVNQPPSAAITAQPTVCANATSSASAEDAGPGATYNWSITGGTITSTTGNTVFFTANSSGSVTLSVVVTNTNGCSASSSTNIPITPAPTPTITAGGPTTFCEGGSVTLTASDAAGGYSWSTGATTQSITVSASGTYSVTVMNAEGCITTSAPTTVTVNPLPAPSISVGGTTTFCEGGSVMLTASAASSYLWSTGATTQSITVSASGSYTVNVTNSDGCSATSAPTTVTVNALPAPSINASGATTFCEGGSVTLTASAGASYLWSTGATTQSITVNASGNYTVSVTNGAGCSATSAPTTVTVNVLPAPSISASGATTFCEGGSVTLTASATSSYLWSTGAMTQSITVSASGNYSVSVTNADGCSATSAPTTVTVNALPAPSITASSATTFCEGGSVTLTASAGASYLWSTGATTQSITVNASGNYSLSVTNADGCSATSAPTTVTVNALPAPSISASGATTFCEGGSVTLTASTASSYLWSTGATTQSITVSASGNYSVSVTNADGCSATSAPTTVTVNALPAPSISASGATTFCEGGSVTLTANAGSSYLWSTGATTQSITVNATGNYSVTVTNGDGCSATSAATTVTVNPTSAATITPSGPTTFCQGGSVTLTASAGASYLWSTGATTQSIVISAGGSYSVTVTNAQGCSTTSAATNVTVNPTPTATITPSGPTTFCQGSSVTLTASAGASYLWSTGATTQSIAVNASGDYSVTVTSAQGCSATSTATDVTVNPKPATPAITASGPTTFCADGSVTLTAPVSSSYLWSTGATTQSITVSSAGSYGVTVFNGSGCGTASSATTVTINAATTITTQPQSVTIPKNTATTLSVSATGTGTLTYQWYRGASGNTSQPVSGATSATYTTPRLTKGTYSYWVRVTGTCGAVNSAAAVVTAQ